MGQNNFLFYYQYLNYYRRLKDFIKKNLVKVKIRLDPIVIYLLQQRSLVKVFQYLYFIIIIFLRSLCKYIIKTG